MDTRWPGDRGVRALGALPRRAWYLATNAVVIAWVVLTLVAVTVHRFVGEPLWLMVHVPLLGAATAAILVWSQHFADTLLRRPAPAGRAGLGIRLIAHSVGAALVIAGILQSMVPLTLFGATIVGAAIMAHGIILAVQLRRALPTRFGLLVRYYVAASIVFLGGIAIGGLMSATADSAATDRLVAAHVVLNAYGWIGLTVLGTLVLLWPTVLHARMPATADRGARHALPLLLGGLAVAVAGPLLDVRPLVAAGLLIWLGGAARLAAEGVRAAAGFVGGDSEKTRVRPMPPATFAGWSLAAAFAWLWIAGAVLAVAALVSADWASLRGAWVPLLGPLVGGFGVQVLMGALSHLLPVVAMGSPAAARTSAQVLDRGAAFRVCVLNGAIALYLAPLPSISRVLLSFAAAGVVVAFVVLAVRAVVVGRRVRRAEGDAPDRSGRISLGGSIGHRPLAPRRRLAPVLLAVAVVVACVAGGVAADPAAVGIATGPSGDVAPSGQTTTVRVTVEGMRFVPGEIEVPSGDRLVVEFHNTGDDAHDLTVANGVRSARLAPGESETLDVGVVGARLAGWCSIAGHRQMGMELSIVVTGAPVGDAAGRNPEHGHAHGTASAGSAADDVDLSAEPRAGFQAHPAALAPASTRRVHRTTLRVSEDAADVAAGVSQARWTFDGTSPGPVLRGRIGDRFEITLVNDGTIGHSIDFHAGALAPDEPMRTIQPGETLTYTFTAERAGIWMYHCSTMPMSMHIANGMYGAVIIDPPELAAVDREYLLVQGELYLGPQGETADAAKLAAKTPDLVAFNGYADQYVHQPLKARAGERVRVWVLDAGPNAPSSFHVVGGQFDTVYHEGVYRLGGRERDPGGAQSLALQPAQGGFVELAFPEAGNYPFVTHIMSDAERGARGIFHVD